MTRFKVVLIRTRVEMERARAVRRAVFIEEQNVPPALEIDEHDGDPAKVKTARHVLGEVEGRAVATGRLILHPDENRNGHIGRVAVLAEERGRGYGSSLMEALHTLARERGLAGITLASQLHAIGFYEKLGYVAKGGVFLEAGIEHRWMDFDLRRKGRSE